MIIQDNTDLIANASHQELSAKRGSTRRNTIFKFGAHIASVLVGIATVPYVIQNLGIESYGIVGIISGIIGLMAIITASLTSTIGRNLTFFIERKEYDNASKELSTAVFSLLWIIIIATIPILCIAPYIDHLINIPAELVSDTRILFILIFFSFAITSISGPVGAAMFVQNRLDIQAGVTFLRQIVMFALIVIFFTVFSPSLVAYGAALLISSLLQFVLHWIINLYLLPGIFISRNWYDRKILRNLIFLGGWVTIGRIGIMLYLQSDLLVANHILGARESGKLAALLIFSTQIRTIASLVSGLFAPNQMSIAAKGDIESFSSYLLRTIRFITLFVALPVGIFCGSTRQILSVWLGDSFALLAPVTIVLTAHLITNLGGIPLWDSLLAFRNVKWPGLITLCGGIANVILSIVLAGPAEMGLMGIAISGCIILTIRNTIIAPWYVSRVCKFDLMMYIREVMIGIGLGIVIGAISYAVSAVIQPQSIIMLVLSLCISAIIGGMLILPFVKSAVSLKPVSAEPFCRKG
ncbi:MAG: lipopolysaccharide biosynthesis protein [Armatimonadota bacterium]